MEVFDTMTSSELLRWCLCVVFGVALTVVELTTKRVPNWLTLGGLVPVFAVAAVYGRGGDAVAGALIAGAASYVVFHRRALAGGGVKAAFLLGGASGLVAGAVIGAMWLMFVGIPEVWVRCFASSSAAQRTWPQVPSSPLNFAAALAGLVAHALWDT